MAETVIMPKLGFDMQEGTLVRWVRNEGEDIKKGEVLAEIETDKATVEVESSASGVVRKVLVGQGAVVPVGAAIAIVGAADEAIDVPAEVPKSSATPTLAVRPDLAGAKATSTQAAPVTPLTTGAAKASPLARKMASDARMDLGQVQGTGPGGRIVRRDVEAALAGAATGRAVSPTGSRVAAIGATERRQDQTAQPSKLRVAIGRRMSESKSTVPHFYVTHEYNVESLMSVREQANRFLAEDQKLSVNDFLVKAAALCLREFPNLNSALDGDRILQHGAINIGIAVSVEGGLLTVVCKDADQKPVRQISEEVRSMAGRARVGKVRPEDIEGSTFTVSNLGMYDVENFTAIINPPEAAILAIGSARRVPVVDADQVRPGWRMKATIAVDHRVSDGAEAARYMQALAKYIEAPAALLL